MLVGLIADDSHPTCHGPQMAKVLRHVGLAVIEIRRNLDPSLPENRRLLDQQFGAADLLYSIGKNKRGPQYAELAKQLGKRIVNHWVGSDALSLLQPEGPAYYRAHIPHIDRYLACAPWIADELRSVGVAA